MSVKGQCQCGKSCPLQSGTSGACGREGGDCLSFHGRVRVNSKGLTTCEMDGGAYKIAVRGVVGRSVDVEAVNIAITPGTADDIWTLFIDIEQCPPAWCTEQDDEFIEIQTMQRLGVLDPHGHHHGKLVHAGYSYSGLCPEMANIHKKMHAKGLHGVFSDFAAKHGYGHGVKKLEDINALRFAVFYVKHAGLDIFNFRSHEVRDEIQMRSVRVGWRPLLRGVAEFLRFVEKLFESQIFHLDVSENNLRYKLEHVTVDDDTTRITHVHFLLIDFGWPGVRASTTRDDLLFKLPTSMFQRVHPCYFMFDMCFTVYCNVMKLQPDRSVDSICEELCSHSFADELPESWQLKPEKNSDMEQEIQYAPENYQDTHTHDQLTRMWDFTAKTVCSGILRYTGDIKQEIATWPSENTPFVARRGDDDETVPKSWMPSFVAIFNYYRSLYYTNKETFCLTPDASDMYKRHFDLYAYVQMMSSTILVHSHCLYHDDDAPTMMKTAAKLCNTLVAHGSTATLQNVCAKIEALSLM